MSAYRIYCTDTEGNRIEYARGLDHTRAVALVNELNCHWEFKSKPWGGPSESAERKPTTLVYHVEKEPSGRSDLFSTGGIHISNYEKAHYQTDDSETSKRTLPGDREGHCGTPDVHRDRADVQEQSQDQREVHVRPAGPRATGGTDAARKGRRRNPTFNSSNHSHRNPTFN